MAEMMRLEGLNTVLKNLNKEISKIRGATRKGLIKATIDVVHDAMKITPTDLSNLVHSAYTVVAGGGGPPLAPKSGQQGAFTASQKGSKRIVDVGRLKNDHEQNINEAKSDGSAWIPIGTIGYSAYYAAYVHEMEGDINWSKQGTGNKFLETAFKQNFNRILKRIKDEATIRP